MGNVVMTTNVVSTESSTKILSSSTGSGSIQNADAIQLKEKKRSYTYARDGYLVDVVLDNVCELIVRPSGDHRIKTTDGQLHIMPAGYVHIAIVDDGEWTV